MSGMPSSNPRMLKFLCSAGDLCRISSAATTWEAGARRSRRSGSVSPPLPYCDLDSNPDTAQTLLPRPPEHAHLVIREVLVSVHALPPPLLALLVRAPDDLAHDHIGAIASLQGDQRKHSHARATVGLTTSIDPAEVSNRDTMRVRVPAHVGRQADAGEGNSRAGHPLAQEAAACKRTVRLRISNGGRSPTEKRCSLAETGSLAGHPHLELSCAGAEACMHSHTVSTRRPALSDRGGGGQVGEPGAHLAGHRGRHRRHGQKLRRECCPPVARSDQSHPQGFRLHAFCMATCFWNSDATIR